MDSTALLTDDEIVALCVADGRPWPIGLSTVEPTAEEFAKAGVRGMRSLMVRRLAGGDAEKDGMRPNEMIANDVAAFLDATDRVAAYIAPAADPSKLGGAAVTAARTEHGWVVDTATAAGVHALRRATADEARTAVLELAENIYNGTFFDDEERRSEWVCVLRFGPNAAGALTIGHGTASGEVNGAAVQAWDPDIVRAAFSAA